MSQQSNPTSEAGITRLDLEIRIRADVRRVWKALVDETTRWWNKDFYTSPSAKGFHIEPRLGGRMYEDWGEGAGLVWATVMGVDPPRSITLIGHLLPAFGGPATDMIEITLQESAEGTLMRLSESLIGRVGDGKLEKAREGWTLLFDGGLRTYVESGATD